MDNPNEATATMRVKSLKVMPWPYATGAPEGETQTFYGEAVMVQSEGKIILDTGTYPISIHMTVPPGCGLVPPFGDDYRVIIQRV